MGIEPQAIEQPLDLSVPENKMMLAFYLAAPEVENTRRSLNVISSMRRARKEGRYLGPAPWGKSYEDGRKYIAPKESDADTIRWAFRELATGKWSVLELWQQAKAKGLICSKNSFWYIIVNPVYCGKILVPTYQNEESYFVEGSHEPLISEELFYTIQNILFSRKRPVTVKQTIREEFPLRNFLICLRCGKVVSASASKGRTSYYSYYHCNSACGWRFKSEHVNAKFVQELCSYKLREGITELYKQVILDAYNNGGKNHKRTKKDIKEVNTLNSRLKKARELLLADTIDAADYKEIKGECERKLNLLEAKLAEAKPVKENIECLLDRVLYNLSHIDERYKKASVEGKSEIIGSIFPEKLQFENEGFRTTKINEAVALIYKPKRYF